VNNLFDSLLLRELADPGAAEAVFYSGLLTVWGVLGIIAFVVLLKKPAPYGRFVAASAEGSRGLSSRWAWAIMESPTVLLFSLIYLLGSRKGVAPTVFLLIWNSHYLYRTVLYPTLLRSRKRVPASIVCSALLFNVINAYLQAAFLFRLAEPYPREWLAQIPFWIGSALFGAGLATHIWTDWRLRQLRSGEKSEYRIPQGGLFNWISCPNYLGEIIQWLGWAVLTWSAAGWLFAWWTFANLFPRALSHRAWYAERFAEYPERRKAILPFVV
jgi:protein-S-isoprenylcysteine O-methyltransferase Ste14